MTTAPRFHHINPQHALRRFANERDQVRVLRRGDLTQPGYCCNIDRVAGERDFYTVATAPGAPHAIEAELLENLEQQASPGFERMLGGVFPPNEEDRYLVATFIAAQWLRTRGRRQAFRAVVEDGMKVAAVNVPRHVIRKFFREEHGREPTESEVDAELDACMNYEPVAHQNQLLEPLVRMLPGITRLTLARSWQLLRVDTSSLVTSDDPVTLWSRSTLASFGVGFGTAEQVLYPIDRRHALVLVNETRLPEEIRELVTRDAHAINSRTALHAQREVIHHPDDDPPMERNLPAPPAVSIDEPGRIVPEGK